MRPILYLPLLLLLLVACNKDNSPSLVGNWREISYVQGLSGGTFYVPADSASILSLRGDGTFKDTIYSTAFSSSGTYSFTHAKSFVNPSAIVLALLFIQKGNTPNMPYTGPLVFFDLNHDTLDLALGAYDGGSTRFVRIK